MAMEGFRGYVQLASGLAEMSRAKAMEAASALLSLSSGLAGGSSGRNVQVQDLAEELLAAAAANRRSLIALDRARAAMAKLSADVEELRAQVLANPAVGEVVAKLGLAGYASSRPVERPAAAAEAGGVASMRPRSAEEGLVVDAALTAPVEEPASAPPRRRPPRTAIAGATSEPAVTRKAATKKATTTKASTKKAATKKAATKKASTKKAATKKAATKRTGATKSTTKKTGTKPATATKTAAKKSATKKSAAKTSTAKKSGATAAKAAPSSSAGRS
jgi:hypothetical protein